MAEEAAAVTVSEVSEPTKAEPGIKDAAADMDLECLNPAVTVSEVSEPTKTEPGIQDAAADLDFECLNPAVTVSEVSETTKAEPGIQDAAADMDLECINPDGTSNGDANLKRVREEGTGTEEDDSGDVSEKKQKVEEKSVEEQRLEKGHAAGGTEDGGQKPGPVTVSLGPKSFGSSVEMFNYFLKFLHYWTPNVNVNKFEHMVLLDLLKKGHTEPDKKIGGGIHAFQVQNHPEFESKCFFLVREDESVDDFSFRKCVDHILPLPENMKKSKHHVGGGKGRVSGCGMGGGHGRGSGKGGGRGRGGGMGGGRGRGGNRWRN